MVNALKTGVSMPRNCCNIPFKMPDLGANNKIQAIFFMIVGNKIG